MGGVLSGTEGGLFRESPVQQTLDVLPACKAPLRKFIGCFLEQPLVQELQQRRPREVGLPEVERERHQRRELARREVDLCEPADRIDGFLCVIEKPLVGLLLRAGLVFPDIARMPVADRPNPDRVAVRRKLASLEPFDERQGFRRRLHHQILGSGICVRRFPFLSCSTCRLCSSGFQPGLFGTGFTTFSPSGFIGVGSGSVVRTGNLQPIPARELQGVRGLSAHQVVEFAQGELQVSGTNKRPRRGRRIVRQHAAFQVRAVHHFVSVNAPHFFVANASKAVMALVPM
jgi:hypothetical protein